MTAAALLAADLRERATISRVYAIAFAARSLHLVLRGGFEQHALAEMLGAASQVADMLADECVFLAATLGTEAKA